MASYRILIRSCNYKIDAVGTFKFLGNYTSSSGISGPNYQDIIFLKTRLCKFRLIIYFRNENLSPLSLDNLL